MARIETPTLLADPAVAAIPVRDCAERLVRLGGGRVAVSPRGPVAPVGPPRGDGGGSHAMVREGLAVRLEAAADLLPAGLRLLVVEGYRPPAVQEALFEGYRRRLVLEQPDLGATESRVLASRFVAPPFVAAHPSGAAVDVTLVDGHGRPADMGTPIDATPEESAGACYFDARSIGSAARANRELLATCLRAAGLVNYPTEWWHWSCGDRYWAFVTGAPAAVYGPVEPPGPRR
jgi:zinc D-Ala-D-Ala dipeptidase